MKNKLPFYCQLLVLRLISFTRFVSANQTTKKSFAELLTTLTSHYEPKPIVITEHFHFHIWEQASGESVTEYKTELRSLAAHCQFGNYLDEALRDRLVCGIHNMGIQKRL